MLWVNHGSFSGSVEEHQNEYAHGSAARLAISLKSVADSNVDTMSAEPNAESTCLSRSERSISSLSSSVNAQAEELANKRVRKSLSSMSRPSSDNISKELLTTMPDELLLLIVRCVCAHNIETDWECSNCNPYWYGWYCDECQRTNEIQYWSEREHYGSCDQSCGCCRTRNWDWAGCELCEDLLELTRTCRRMRNQLKTYNGR